MPSNDLHLENLPRRRLNACDSDPSPVWDAPFAALAPQPAIVPTPPTSTSTSTSSGPNTAHARQMSHSSSSSFPFAEYINFQPGFTAAPTCNDDVSNDATGNHESTSLRLIPDLVACNSSSTVCLLFRDARLFDSHFYSLRLIPTADGGSNIINNSHPSANENVTRGTWPGAVYRAANHSHADTLPSSTLFPCLYQNKYVLTCELPAHLSPGRHLAEVVDTSSDSVVASASFLVDSVSESLSRLIESSTNPLTALADALGLDVSDNATLDRHLCKLFRQNTPYEPFDRALRLSSSSSCASAPRETTRKYPSLLHLAAAYGLKDLCANMVDCPGVEVLQRMSNVDGSTPRDLANAAGFHELASFLASYQRNREVVDAARVTLYRKFTAAVGLYDVKSYYMLMTPPHSPPNHDARATESANGADDSLSIEFPRSSEPTFNKSGPEESFESVFGSVDAAAEPAGATNNETSGEELNGVGACCLPPANGGRLIESATPSSALLSSVTPSAAITQPKKRSPLPNATSTDINEFIEEVQLDSDGGGGGAVVEKAEDVDLSRSVIRQTSEDLGYVTMSSSRQNDHVETSKQQAEKDQPQRQKTSQHRSTDISSRNQSNYMNSPPVPVTKSRHSVHSSESAFHVHESRISQRETYGRSPPSNDDFTNEFMKPSGRTHHRESYGRSLSPNDEFTNEYMKMSKVDATSTPCLLTEETIRRETGGALFGISPTKPHLLEQPVPTEVGTEEAAGKSTGIAFGCVILLVYLREFSPVSW